MKTVFTIKKTIEFSPLTEKQFNEFKFLNRLSFGIVKNENDRPTDHGKTQWCLMPFERANKIAEKHNQIVVSQHFWKNKNSCFLIFFPQTGDYKLRIESKNKVPVPVSEETYNACLADIQDQKQQDRLYNWRPAEKDYYNIDNWTFNIKEGKLVH